MVCIWFLFDLALRLSETWLLSFTTYSTPCVLFLYLHRYQGSLASLQVWYVHSFFCCVTLTTLSTCCCCRRQVTSVMSDSVRPHRSSPPSSAVPWILQARTREWVAISFSNAWKWKVKVRLLSRVRLFTTPWTTVYQAPPSMGFSRQEYWVGCRCLLHRNTETSYKEEF